MKSSQTIVIYLLTFLIFSILLKLLGFIDVSNSEIIGYACIFYGISAVYISLGRNRKLLLFTGSVIFLAGVTLFLINNFDFFNAKDILLPALLFILAAGAFMLFIDNARTLYLLVSIIFILTGLIYTSIFGKLDAGDFISSAVSISEKSWPALIILLGIIIIMYRDDKSK